MKSSKLIAVIIAVVALVWIGSGFLKPEEISFVDAQTVSKEKKAVNVRVREIKAELYADDIVVTGRSRASKSVEIKAETSGQLQTLLKEEGDHLLVGEVLAELELRDREAKVKEAHQRLNQRQIEYNAARKLEGKGFNSKIRLAQAHADLETAIAELKQAEIELSKTKITAPFDGIIYEQRVEIGDYLDVGDVVFHVVDLDPIEFTGFISERRIQEIELGRQAQAQFLSGTNLAGMVSYIAPAADPDTRTFRVVISAPNPDLDVKEGLTARISIPVTQRKAHKISPSILSLNDAGQIGIKIVNADNKVEFVPVSILADEPEAMWVHGPPPVARIITVGQDFVSEGQKVNPVLATGEGLL